MAMILISACLLGWPVRYDGGHCLNQTLKPLFDRGLALAVCPEQLGGLPTPRLAAEIIGGDGADVLAGRARVCDAAGADVSSAYIDGAHRALALVQQHGATAVILKANSPSCGSRTIYDGRFQGCLKAGVGVTAALLYQHGVLVCDETNMQAVLNTLSLE